MARFNRWAALALLLALLAVPAWAAKPDFGSQWTLPCGQQGEFQAESQANRIANLMAASKLLRVGFEVSGPTFDPDREEVILQECWTPGTFLAAADAAGARLQLVAFLHASGAHNGNGYHQVLPLLDKHVVRAWFESLVAYIRANHPGMRVLGANGKGVQYVAIGNEFGYCPRCNPDTIVAQYLEILDHVRPVWPSQWQVIDGGLVGRTNVTAQQLRSRGVWGSVHCNHDSDNECRQKISECVSRFGSCVIDEDIVDGGGSRYRICDETPGCKLYAPMWARSSGNPPLSSCCWKVRGCGSNDTRTDVGVESCGYVMNDGTVPQNLWGRMKGAVGIGPPTGTVDNYRAFNDDARRAGTATPGWDFYALPNTIEGPPPPPPPPPAPPAPGEVAFFRLMRELGVLDGNASEEARALYALWLARVTP